MELQDFFRAHPRIALAFSGGTDSAYLLYAARTAGADIRAYFVNSAFQPAFEREDALRLCRELSVPLTVVDTDVLSVPAVTANSADRCYWCKRSIFAALIRQAYADGYWAVMDGTNASDDAEDRPGMRALRELGVLSPLRLCGITKAEVRRRSAEAGLFTADKPAYACLATRIPTGCPITADLLARVESAEEQLFALQFTDFRVRVFHDAAKLQVPEDQLARAAALHREIRRALAPWFSDVLLDLKER